MPLRAVPRPAPRAPLRPAADRPARRPGDRTISTRRSGRGCGRPVRAVLAANNTLLGRMVIGPFLGMCVPLARRPRARSAPATGGWRGPGAARLPGSCRWRSGWRWPGRCRSGPYLARLLAGARRSCGSAPSSSTRRTSGPAARSVIIEDRGPLALLFLNNNFHAVHHAQPAAALVPAARRVRPAARVSGCGATAATATAPTPRSSGATCCARKDPVAHPIWTPPEPGARPASGPGGRST